MCAPKGKKYAALIEMKLKVRLVKHLFIDFESSNGKIEAV